MSDFICKILIKEYAHETEDYGRAGGDADAVCHMAGVGHTQRRWRRDSVFEQDDVGVREAIHLCAENEGSEGYESDGYGNARLLGEDPEGEGEGVHTEEVPEAVAPADHEANGYSATNSYSATDGDASTYCYATTYGEYPILAATGGEAGLV